MEGKSKLIYKLCSFFRLKLPRLNIIRPCRFHSNYFEGYNMVDSGTIIKNCHIGKFSYISFNSRILRSKIGRFCSIGPRVYTGFSTHPTDSWVTTHPAFYMNLFSTLKYTIHSNREQIFNPYKEAENGFLTVIGNDVWIGADVKIMDGVTIGNGAIIAAGAVVTKNVEPYSIVGGIPAKIIKYRFKPTEIEFLEHFKWWEKPISWIKNHYLEFSNIENFKTKYKDE